MTRDLTPMHWDAASVEVGLWVAAGMSPDECLEGMGSRPAPDSTWADVALRVAELAHDMERNPQLRDAQAAAAAAKGLEMSRDMRRGPPMGRVSMMEVANAA